jgi:hypothetical protein
MQQNLFSWSAVWSLLYVMLLVAGILRWVLDFGKFVEGCIMPAMIELHYMKNVF